MNVLLQLQNPDQGPVVRRDTHAAGEANGMKFGASAVQGYGSEMEDRRVVCSGLPELGGSLSLFAVMDGHGGTFTASFAESHLVEILRQQEYYKMYADLPAQSLRDDPIGTEIMKQALRDAFCRIDTELDKEMYWGFGDVNAFTGKQDRDGSGCACCLVLVTPMHVFCASAGTSRACLRSQGEIVQLSSDHMPFHVGEADRIEAAGGYVSLKMVDGEVPMSRGFGFLQHKNVGECPPEKQKISCVPDVTVFNRDFGSDEFLLVASRGVWEVFSSDECINFIQQIFDEGETDVSLVCEELVDACLEKRSKENITALAVAFPAAKITKGGGGVECRRQFRNIESEEKKAETEEEKCEVYSNSPERRLSLIDPRDLERAKLTGNSEEAKPMRRMRRISSMERLGGGNYF